MTSIFYYALSTLFVFLVPWMVQFPDHKKYQEWVAVVLIYLGLYLGIQDQNDTIVVSFGVVSGCIAIINHHYNGFVGV